MATTTVVSEEVNGERDETDAVVDRGDATAQPIAPVSVPKAVSPKAVPDGAELDHPSLYLNKELSWIDFNWRVLAQAMDERSPLLERVKFVAITASNLDEFIQKRVGGLKRQEAAGVRQLSADGRTPSEQLEMLRTAIGQMHAKMTSVWEDDLRPRLADEAGIVVQSYDRLDAEQRKYLHDLFRAEIYQMLTPLAVDPGHPFPFISNLKSLVGRRAAQAPSQHHTLRPVETADPALD